MSREEAARGYYERQREIWARAERPLAAWEDLPEDIREAWLDVVDEIGVEEAERRAAIAAAEAAKTLGKEEAARDFYERDRERCGEAWERLWGEPLPPWEEQSEFMRELCRQMVKTGEHEQCAPPWSAALDLYQQADEAVNVTGDGTELRKAAAEVAKMFRKRPGNV